MSLQQFWTPLSVVRPLLRYLTKDSYNITKITKRYSNPLSNLRDYLGYTGRGILKNFHNIQYQDKSRRHRQTKDSLIICIRYSVRFDENIQKINNSYIWENFRDIVRGIFIIFQINFKVLRRIFRYSHIYFGEYTIRGFSGNKCFVAEYQWDIDGGIMWNID